MLAGRLDPRSKPQNLRNLNRAYGNWRSNLFSGNDQIPICYNQSKVAKRNYDYFTANAEKLLLTSIEPKESLANYGAGFGDWKMQFITKDQQKDLKMDPS